MMKPWQMRKCMRLLTARLEGDLPKWEWPEHWTIQEDGSVWELTPAGWQGVIV